RATKRGRMLHERRLTALDSSAPLLFIEAIPGSGKRAMPVAVAFLGGDEIDGADLDLLMRLLESGIRVIVASFDLSRVQELAGQRGVCSTTLGDRETWLTLGEVRVLVRGQGVTLSEDAVDALYNATLGHPGMILASLETMPVESAAGLVTRDRALAAFLSASCRCRGRGPMPWCSGSSPRRATARTRGSWSPRWCGRGSSTRRRRC